jgi:hypothetical protein
VKRFAFWRIAELSKVVESLKDSKAKYLAPALVPISREAHGMKLSSLNKESKQRETLKSPSKFYPV